VLINVSIYLVWCHTTKKVVWCGCGVGVARLILGRRLALAGHHTDMIAERRQITNWPCTGWPKNYTFSSDHNTAVCLKRLRRYVEFRMFGSSGPTGNTCSSSGPPCGHEKIRCFRLYIQSFTVPRILLLLHRIMLVVRRYEEAAIVQDIWRARFCTKPIPDRSHYV